MAATADSLPTTDLITLKCLARADDFQRKLPLKFGLREELLLNPSPSNDPTLTHTSSPLLNLPYDILHLLFRTLAHAPSQICLLLTCKRLHYLLTVPAPPALTLSTTSPKYAGHLPLRVFDVPALLTQLKGFGGSMGDGGTRLCAHCLTFRPCPPYGGGVCGVAEGVGVSLVGNEIGGKAVVRSVMTREVTGGVGNGVVATTTTTTTMVERNYWHGVKGCGTRCDFWIQKTGWEFYNGGWNKIVHDICPYCHGSCSLGDFGDCDGCSALGRLGDVNWSRLGEAWRRRRVEEQVRAGVFAT